MASLASLIPLVLFLLVALAASIVVRRRADAAGGGFVNSYFIGNRALGGFVLAMTTIATYGSVSSFVGGPGQAWQIGFGWVYMAVMQVTALVLLYGIFGKKMALISRKLDAVTVVDVVRARYGSNALANVSALVIVLFFAATMVAQFVGGAKLFEAVTGYSYLVGLALFGVAVVLFTTIGGFRGVAVTDALCGIMMLVGIVVLAGGILTAGGGYEAIMTSIKETSPEMLEPFAGGAMPPSLYFTQWLLVGVFTDDLMKVEDIKNGYCTQFLINKYEGASAAKMRAFAESNGDSVVCIEDDDVINLHVHTADPGKILSEAIKYGYLTNFKIENMHEQFLARQKQGKSLEKQASAEKAPAQASEFVYAAVDPSRDYGFVAVAAGEGLKAVFTDLAADAVVSGGQTMNPATEDILAAIQSVPAKTVFVLPNNKNIIMAAEQAQKLADRQVIVLPTRTVPMGITALLNFDPSANAETNTINMMAAADKVSTGLITYAARDSEFDGKRIRKGEIMALENGKIVATSTDLTKATYRLARSMCKKDSSFVTIISGCDVSDEEAEKLTEIVKAKCPNHVEVSHIRGGQPVYYYMISVE